MFFFGGRDGMVKFFRFVVSPPGIGGALKRGEEVKCSPRYV